MPGSLDESHGPIGSHSEPHQPQFEQAAAGHTSFGVVGTRSHSCETQTPMIE